MKKKPRSATVKQNLPRFCRSNFSLRFCIFSNFFRFKRKSPELIESASELSETLALSESESSAESWYFALSVKKVKKFLTVSNQAPKTTRWLTLCRGYNHFYITNIITVEKISCKVWYLLWARFDKFYPLFHQWSLGKCLSLSPTKLRSIRSRNKAKKLALVTHSNAFNIIHCQRRLLWFCLLLITALFVR